MSSRADPADSGHRRHLPGNRFTLEGHDLIIIIIEVAHTDTDESSVLYVPDLGLVVAGDVIYRISGGMANGATR